MGQHAVRSAWIHAAYPGRTHGAEGVVLSPYNRMPRLVAAASNKHTAGVKSDFQQHATQRM